MASRRSYGDILRRARENSGVDIVTMARHLHIRPDILKAIEQADFEKMPQRGYSRNMIRAYARQVGLDEREISERYLDEVQIYETGVPRDSPYGSRSPYSRDGDSRRPGQGGDRSLRFSSSDSYGRQGGSRSSRYSTSLSFEDRQRLEDDGRNSDRSIRFYSSPRSRSRINEARSQEFPPNRRGNVPKSLRFDDSADTKRSITLPKTSNSYKNIYSDSSRSNGISVLNNINMPLLIIIAIVAIALIIVMVVLFNGGKQAADEVPNIPISGLTDTSDPENTISPVAPESTAPASADFKFEVASGSQSWIEIYENGNSTPILSEVVSGPFSQNYSVTGTLTFYTANPTPVKIYVDNAEVKLSPSSSKSGYYSYLVDFPAILAQWQSEHNVGDTSGAQNTANNTGSSSNASNANRTNGATNQNTNTQTRNTNNAS